MKLAIILLWFITSLCYAPQKAEFDFYKYETSCLSKAIYFEAGNQSQQGKLAVANVVKNRKNQWKLKSYCSVIYQKNQFSWIKKHKYPTPGTANYKNWNTSKLLASEFVYHPTKYKDNTNGSLFFHATYVHPNWKLTKTKTIQGHVFYK